MFPYCGNCQKKFNDDRIIILGDNTDEDEPEIGYFCSLKCLKEWLDKHR
jgi:hypothetical protein